MTVSAWVNIDATRATSRYIVAKGASGCIAASYALYTGANGGLEFYVSSNGGLSYTISPDAGTDIWDGNWHSVDRHLQRVRRCDLYVDGKEVGSRYRRHDRDLLRAAHDERPVDRQLPGADRELPRLREPRVQRQDRRGPGVQPGARRPGDPPGLRRRRGTCPSSSLTTRSCRRARLELHRRCGSRANWVAHPHRLGPASAVAGHRRPGRAPVLCSARRGRPGLDHGGRPRPAGMLPPAAGHRGSAGAPTDGHGRIAAAWRSVPGSTDWCSPPATAPRPARRTSPSSAACI